MNSLLFFASSSFEIPFGESWAPTWPDRPARRAAQTIKSSDSFVMFRSWGTADCKKKSRLSEI
jgi:hypothetical protein